MIRRNVAKLGLNSISKQLSVTAISTCSSAASLPSRCSFQSRSNREQHRSLSTSNQALNSSPSSQSDVKATDPSSFKPMPPTGETVQLDFESYSPPQNAQPFKTDARAIVVCHGLFGSKQNWRSLAKLMAQKFSLPVYAVDLRNHGTSPHISGMNYADMASDLLRFFKEHGLQKVALIGHSMGGKTVQAVALSPDLPPAALSHLISVDMSPARGPLSKEFEGYVDAMLTIEAEKCKSRNEADEVLKRWEPELGIRQFILTNIQREKPGSDFWTFRIPLKTIQYHLPQIGDFPYDPPAGGDGERPEREWDGKTLFVKGKNSKYINRKNTPICKDYFPNAEHVELNTGHWVQAEDGRGFVRVVGEFLQSN